MSFSLFLCSSGTGVWARRSASWDWAIWWGSRPRWLPGEVSVFVISLPAEMLLHLFHLKQSSGVPALITGKSNLWCIAGHIVNKIKINTAMFTHNGSVEVLSPVTGPRANFIDFYPKAVMLHPVLLTQSSQSISGPPVFRLIGAILLFTVCCPNFHNYLSLFTASWLIWQSCTKNRKLIW